MNDTFQGCEVVCVKGDIATAGEVVDVWGATIIVKGGQIGSQRRINARDAVPLTLEQLEQYYPQSPQPGDPTLEEIWNVSAPAIKATWSKEERRRRRSKFVSHLRKK